MIKGIAASPGIVIGKVLTKKEQRIALKPTSIVNCSNEVKLFKKALKKAKEQVKELYNLSLNKMGKEEAQIFEAHLMILDDPEFFKKVKQEITSENLSAAAALEKVATIIIHAFENMDNEYMRERAADIRDITGRLAKILAGVETKEFAVLAEDVIIAAKELTPSDTAQMDKGKVIGFIAETGGRTSHSAIMARTLEIPAVVGATGIMAALKDGDTVVFDGSEGIIHLNPPEEIVLQYKRRKEEQVRFKSKLSELIGARSISKDGVSVELAANIGTPEDVEGVLENDGEGIGLFRSEFLYMGRDNLPGEEEQFEAYKDVLKKMAGKPVVIRTLDIGGDKELSYLNLPVEVNPFLGYRAIRICLDRKDIFQTQLRALLRASVFGNLKIMFPMISSIEELREAKGILAETKQLLKNEDIEFSANIEVGIMIEIPSVAIISDLFAKEVDFFSIGTNDLIQYTTAVDRMNEKVSYLYSHFHPALLRLVKQVIESGHQEGIWVGMCGEAAGDEKLIPVLLGMGLDEFSMSAGAVLKARWIINNVSKAEMAALVDEILNLPTALDVERFIEENIAVSCCV